MHPRLLVCLLSLAVWGLSSSLPAQSGSSAAAPVALRFTVKGLTVTAAVERGVQQVVLEQKSGAGWKPLSVSYPVVKTGRATFRLTVGVPADDLRVQGYRSIKFPARFLRGKRSFERKDLAASGDVISGNVLTLTGATLAVNPLTISSSVAGTSAMRALSDPGLITTPVTDTVVESDIWQIVGSQVYFFNQYRGLQILDLSDPELPVRTGSLRLPASGEQMLILDEAGTQVALLGRSNEKGRQGAATVWLIRVTDGVPVMTGEVPLEGAITDSRLVGTTLHVLCSISTSGTNNLNGSANAVLTSIDLSDLDAARKLGSLSFPSSSAVLQAAGGYLLVSTNHTVGGNMHVNRALHLVDISAAPRVVKTFTPRGQIQDKFKLGVVNDCVVAVSLVAQNWNDRQTWVETFPISTRSTDALAALELEGARGETLHATRFDGDRLYVVTFRQVDPLFIVDLADPSAPVLSGVLEVPGWSTYLEPLGDRLLAVGLESGHVTVSLFDVTDVTAPALLSSLSLGDPNMGSWSEASYDEKAVEYLPDEGIVMVPFEGWSGTGPQRAIQVVNVGTDELTAGPTIEHEFNPRRGSFIAGHYVTISGRELLVHSTGSASSGGPVVSLPLAWRTDRVVPVGDHLIQIEDGQSGLAFGVISLRAALNSPGADHARLRITSTTDPDALEQLIDLGAGRIVGITQRHDHLYLAQWVPGAYNSPAHSPQHLRTLSLDLSSTPPVITETGRASHDLSSVNEYELRLDLVKPLWVNDEKLVWHLPLQSYYGFWARPILGLPVLVQPVQILPVLVSQPGLTIASPILAGTLVRSSGTASTVAAPPPAAEPPPGNPAAVLCPVTADASGGITAETALVVRVKGSLRGTSNAFTQNGYLFFSYDLAVEKPVPATSRVPNASLLTRGPVISIPYRPQDCRIASWLQVIDWNAAEPVLRDAVSIPGPLLSVAQADAQGAVILTNSDQQISRNGPATRIVQACAYDGVSAWQLDSYITSTPFHSATATDGVRLYLGREVGTIGAVGLGYNTLTGRLSQINSWATAETPTVLQVISGHLLASSYGNLEVATITASSGFLTPVASYDTPTNLCLRVDRAAFTPSQDLWIPAADFGVELLQRAALAP